MFYIFVLRLKDDKYYVERTDNPLERLAAHCSGDATRWTRIFPPCEVIETLANMDPFDEDKMVKQYMQKYGIDNVRGGSYINQKLTQTQLIALRAELWRVQMACMRCGRSGHGHNSCYSNFDVDGNELIPHGHDKIPTCTRCGRKRHSVDECVARLTIDKRPLEPRPMPHIGCIGNGSCFSVIHGLYRRHRCPYNCQLSTCTNCNGRFPAKRMYENHCKTCWST
jgi:predicted GIY-YIG superfamily endonuclease